MLFVGRGLNFQLTTDQVLTKVFGGTKYRILDVCAAWKSGGASVVCAGGLYDAAAKGGNALVAAAQSWVTLASGIIVPAVIGVTSVLESTGTLYLSLTTGSTAACTADLFVYGYALD
jgi:hypothetical protein